MCIHNFLTKTLSVHCLQPPNVAGSRGAGIHRAKGRIKPGYVASSLQGDGDRTNNHTHIRAHNLETN